MTQLIHQSSNSRYLALEGGVCAGKTTVSRIVAAQKHIGWVPEYYDFISADDKEKLGQMSPQARCKFFLEVDQRRTYSTKINIRPRVSDRSVLSIIATEYALNRMSKDHNLTSITGLHEDIHVIPNNVFFLDIPHGERINRWNRRNPNSPSLFFIDEEFNRLFREFFEKLNQILPVVFIDNYQTKPDDTGNIICEHPSHIKSVSLNQIMAQVLQL